MTALKRALFVAALAAVAAWGLVNVRAPRALAQTSGGPKFLAFAFTNDAHGWTAGVDGIDVTQDGGHSWTSQFRGRRVDELVIVRRRSVYALAEGGAILHTVNDGAVWELVAQPQPALRHIAFSSENNGFGIGADQLLYATADGAKTWHRAAFEQPVDAVCFSDKRTGFVGGAVSAPALRAFDGIATTGDGGRTWSQVAHPPTAGLVGIAGHTLACTRGSVFDLVDLGPHAGGGAYVLAHSTDAARSWRTVVTGGQTPIEPNVPHGPGTEATSMGAYSPRAVYIAGFCGACGASGQSSFGTTTDAGRTWQNVTLDAIGFTSAPVFTSPHHGWIGARVLSRRIPTADEILVTDDAGHTWKTLFTAR